VGVYLKPERRCSERVAAVHLAAEQDHRLWVVIGREALFAFADSQYDFFVDIALQICQCRPRVCQHQGHSTCVDNLAAYLHLEQFELPVEVS